MNVNKVKRLSVVAVGSAAMMIGGGTASAAPRTPTSGGAQAGPGGVVNDATGGYYDPARGIYVGTAPLVRARTEVTVKAASGGYYDPARSIYVPKTRPPASTVTGSLGTYSGSIARDAGGGYYDPARSIYVASSVDTKSSTGLLGRSGLTWTNVSLGAAAAGATILLLLGAALLTVRRRSVAV
jgi:hypothetical protein